MKTLYTLLLSACVVVAFAQDPHFSNFSNHPLNLNPALTGQIPNHSTRVQAGYRDQWRSFLEDGAFRTLFASFDKRFCTLIPGDFWSIGTSITADQRGDARFQRMDILISGTFMKQLSGDRDDIQIYLGIGAEGGAIQHRLGNRDFTFDEQFDNPALPDEIFDNYSFTMLDYGAGLSFYLVDRTQSNLGINFGGAIKHLGEPEFNFFDSDDGIESRLKRRYVLHGSGVFPVLKNKLGIGWKGVYTYQEPYSQITNRIEAIFNFNRYTLFTLGAGMRQVDGVDGTGTDALIFSSSLTFDHFVLSVDYDTNVSTLNAVSQGIGAWEFTLGILFGKGDCDVVYCPY